MVQPAPVVAGERPEGNVPVTPRSRIVPGLAMVAEKE
jgi:hypothetical protein